MEYIESDHSLATSNHLVLEGSNPSHARNYHTTVTVVLKIKGTTKDQ